MFLNNLLLPNSVSRPQSRIAPFVLRWFLFLYFLTAMGAYSIGPIPIAWLAQAGFIALAIGVIMFTDRITVVPGAMLFAVLLVWEITATAMNLGTFSNAMPIMVKTPYAAYITFRYLNLVAFFAALYLTYWLIGEGESNALVRGIVVIGVAVSAIALYIYLAHFLHLPEPPRTRAGTNGGEQNTEFSSNGFSYGRAQGTFREPSGLAEWLILPFFLSYSFRDRAGKIRSAIMTVTVVLTVSMMGFFSIVSGGLAGFLLTKPFSKRTYKIVGFAILIGALLYAVLTQISIGVFGENKVSLATVLGNRVWLTLIGGVGNSNRAYVYDYLATNPFPPLGMGIGNGNLEFSNVTGNETIVSFLSVYLFTLYSVGYPGMIVLGAFLLRPLAEYLINFKKTLKVPPVILMAYLGYLVSSTVGAEELSAWFGITAALLAGEARLLSSARRYFSRNPAASQLSSLSPALAD